MKKYAAKMGVYMIITNIIIITFAMKNVQTHTHMLIKKRLMKIHIIMTAKTTVLMITQIYLAFIQRNMVYVYVLIV